MWDQIRANRRRSAFVVGAMGVLLVALGSALGAAIVGDPAGAVVGGLGAFVTWLLMWGVTVARGDDIMLGMAGAREIQHQDHPVLFNVVEEMTVAAGLGGRPRVYVVDDPSPNAFAAGRDPRKACVAVTTGLLRILDRDELQGVVAHEIGHIRNRDVALMTTAGVMLGSIVLMTEVGARAFRFSGGRRRPRDGNGDNGAQFALMLVAMAVIVLSPLLAQLLYFSLSRRREYLADASGAMFTRYPEGLARALEKLGGDVPTQADTSRVTAPMYIVRPVRRARGLNLGIFATHPPLEERVRILRNMAGADYQAYDESFRRASGRSIVGTATLESTSRVELRAAQAPNAGQGEALALHERAREASDAYLAAAGYDRRRCTRCEARVKIPRSLAGRDLACPRCAGELVADGFGA